MKALPSMVQPKSGKFNYRGFCNALKGNRYNAQKETDRCENGRRFYTTLALNLGAAWTFAESGRSTTFALREA